MAVAIEGGRLTKIAKSGSFATAPGTAVIDCQGRTLMPGLIDAHVHLAAVDLDMAANSHQVGPVVVLRIAALIEETLQAGFTTVRDAGGLPGGYKAAQTCSSAAGLYRRQAAMPTTGCVPTTQFPVTTVRSTRNRLSSMGPSKSDGRLAKIYGAAATRSR
jgi:predicted amidohydrolase YtcJ